MVPARMTIFSFRSASSIDLTLILCKYTNHHLLSVVCGHRCRAGRNKGGDYTVTPSHWSRHESCSFALFDIQY
uniref:Secreted protein n=1 Tax=Panagrellus redivivus TaxID=6233 RepID=A0A7E4VLK9_PANRE